MPDFKVGDRVVVCRSHQSLSHVLMGDRYTIAEVKFLHQGQRYYHAIKEGGGSFGLLHPMLELDVPLTPFEAEVRDYIRSEMKT